MQRFATCCLYITCALLGVLAGADGTAQAAVVKQAYVNDRVARVAKNVENYRRATDDNLIHVPADSAEETVGLFPVARRRVKRSGLPFEDDHYTWALYGGLLVLAVVFFTSVVCWCTHWSAWIRSADGLTLFRDHSSPLHLAYPTYDNLAFSSYAEKDLALGDGVVLEGGYYEKSPNVHTYTGPRYCRCSESIV